MGFIYIKSKDVEYVKKFLVMYNAEYKMCNLVWQNDVSSVFLLKLHYTMIKGWRVKIGR